MKDCSFSSKIKSLGTFPISYNLINLKTSIFPNARLSFLSKILLHKFKEAKKSFPLIFTLLKINKKFLKNGR